MRGVFAHQSEGLKAWSTSEILANEYYDLARQIREGGHDEWT
jgi:hypothetical protein